MRLLVGWFTSRPVIISLKSIEAMEVTLPCSSRSAYSLPRVMLLQTVVTSEFLVRRKDLPLKKIIVTNC